MVVLLLPSPHHLKRLVIENCVKFNGIILNEFSNIELSEAIRQNILIRETCLDFKLFVYGVTCLEMEFVKNKTSTKEMLKCN